MQTNVHIYCKLMYLFIAKLLSTNYVRKLQNKCFLIKVTTSESNFKLHPSSNLSGVTFTENEIRENVFSKYISILG